MHWLPLVAMVIASALPFPHNPVSKIATATAEPGFDKRGEHRHDPAARLAAAPADYSFNGSASQTDYNMTAALSQHSNRQNLQSRKDYVKPIREETFKVESRGTHQSNSNSGSNDRSSLDVPTERATLRAEDVSRDSSVPKDYKPGSTSRYEYAGFVDFSKKDNLQDATDRPLQVSALENHVSPATTHKGQTGPKLTTTSDQFRDTQKIGTASQRTVGTGRGFPKESLTMEDGLGLGGLDNILKGDELFLDAHPRVLFSSSPSPPEDPPLLLMLETGMLEEDRDWEEQEAMDERIEGHGDRALDRSTTLSWADSARLTREGVHPVKRDKRSHLTDRSKEGIRSREQSVCEAISVWVNKTEATDFKGENVSVLQEIQTQRGPLQQYFYETNCHHPNNRIQSKGAVASAKSLKPRGIGVAGGSCLGVDKKQWNSECRVKQSYVRALTKDNRNRIAWRWIRINSSCVCVLLSRANPATGREVLTRRGRA